MIQCYKPDNTDYDHNGDITLFPTSCKLPCEINSTWELSMSHPLDSDGRWKYLSEEAVISAPTFQSDKQLFRVDKCIKTDSSVEVTAYPIFFDSADDCFLMDTRPTNQNGQNALNIMTQNSKYSGESDITTGGTAYFVRRNLMDAINGEDSLRSFRHGAEKSCTIISKSLLMSGSAEITVWKFVTGRTWMG